MMPGRDIVEKASPILKIASGGIYLTFAVFFIVMAVELYTGNVYLTPAITSYLPILMYLLPVAVLLSFVGWYFSRRAPSYPDIFMTVSSALLVAGYLIMWAFAGASFEGLLYNWIYWVPPMISLMLGVYSMTGIGIVSPKPGPLESLFDEASRRALRPIGRASGPYQAIPLTYGDREERRSRRALRSI